MKKAVRKPKITSCELCASYEYDEESGFYICQVSLDEDEMCRFLSGQDFACPYYTPGDEYRIVRRQM